MKVLLTIPERDAEHWGFWFAAWLAAIGVCMGCVAWLVEEPPRVWEDETGFEGVVTVLWVVGWIVAGAGGFMAVFGRFAGGRRAWLKLLCLDVFPAAAISVALGMAGVIVGLEATARAGWWGLAGVAAVAAVCIAVLMRSQGRIAVRLVREARAGAP